MGPQKLPELARTIGRGLSEFRKVQDEVKDMVKLDLSMDPVTTPTTAGADPAPHPPSCVRPAPEAASDADEEPSDGDANATPEASDAHRGERGAGTPEADGAEPAADADHSDPGRPAGAGGVARPHAARPEVPPPLRGRSAPGR